MPLPRTVIPEKFEGHRCLPVVDDTVTLWSRSRKELTRYFPDLVAAAERKLPEGCIVDGEVVIWNDNRLDFDALQRRMVTAKAALPALARELPSSFAAFDVLAVAGQDTRALPFSSRRALLEELARDWSAPLGLSPGTTDAGLARTWFEGLPATGVEGHGQRSLAAVHAGHALLNKNQTPRYFRCGLCCRHREYHPAPGNHRRTTY